MPKVAGNNQSEYSTHSCRSFVMPHGVIIFILLCDYIFKNGPLSVPFRLINSVEQIATAYTYSANSNVRYLNAHNMRLNQNERRAEPKKKRQRRRHTIN